MGRVFFSTWNDEFVNNCGKLIEEWKELAYNLPTQHNVHRDSSMAGVVNE